MKKEFKEDNELSFEGEYSWDCEGRFEVGCEGGAR